MQKKVRRKRQILRNKTVILRSSRELFHKKGFYGTTMEEIAEYSGFDRRTIYNHFKNKEDIFSALISGILTEIAAVFDEIESEKIPTLEKLRKIVLALLDIFIENAQMLNIFMSEYEINETKKKRYISAYTLKNIHDYKEIESRLIRMIRQAQDEGLVVNVHPYVLAGVLNELLMRSVIVLHNQKGGLRKKDLIRDIFEILSKNVVTVPVQTETAP
ncbi:MAG: TetR/AcrR family transcriptional regulator [Desulfomonilia bacterium]|jgi:AcrR family transcriptional regulator|uniref:HTH-type transcriptional regulator MtrR n=1 Tax=anaerobic digester metagenome TaxID=1263854 RepID=A0A485M7F0_9ZZZZ|nr:TetR/AcrR family transcriptional regulator [Pseudomonadota bacterium]HON39641.1 TetR/AcrR family transcriptional regulator [Deltaproteobacteria bacterium]HRS57460.1 TetR/AcrR family transcriptional regulator [Desulfomonilia bacterium]HPD22269.1 TetR/AcrR family transcriptional regulator [Deltaproteobacteria bacterium]HPX19675.1 TetR/AcrR family transcriptional regulator [Deltaproteobacteria bacterium]